MAVTEDQQLLAYVPRLVADWPKTLEPPGFQEVSGSLLFADISGFTRMSERLAKRGRVGAEEVVSVINGTFARLLAVAYAEEGGLLKFGGDALLLFFPGDEHEIRAARAGARMRKELREIGALRTSAGAVRLQISIGIHSDTFHLYLVGDSHRDFIVCGPAATRTVEMEQAAEAGEVLLSPETAQAIHATNRGDQKGPGVLLRGIPQGTKGATPSGAISATLDVTRCIPTAVREHLLGGGEGAAHRQVTVMFLHYDGIDDLARSKGPEAVCDALDELVRIAQEAADKHEIAYLDSDIDRGGGKIYFCAGAPIAREDDDGRMLLAARYVLDANPTLPVHLGVNRGRVFAGDIGPHYRKTYTIMGDAVNLAARVMTNANAGEVLATKAVVDNSQISFQADPLEPFRVKGKSQPVVAFRVGAPIGRRSETRKKTPLFGRDQEMSSLAAFLDSARLGKGSLAEIVGDPGVGKTRLTEEVLVQAPEASVLSVMSDLYGSTTPYSSIKKVMRAALAIQPAATESEATTDLKRIVLEKVPSLEPFIPLLGVALGLKIADTPQTENLEDKFRKARLEESVDQLLEVLLKNLSVFVFEDAQWMDEASVDLVRRLGSNAGDRPWLILITRRDVETGFTTRELAGAQKIKLGPLSKESVMDLLIEATEEAPMRPHELQALAERSGGNPLFVAEILDGLAASEDRGVYSLPDSVEKAIAIRIDRLSPRDRTALRKLSVLGSEFDVELVPAVLGKKLSIPDLLARFSEFIERDQRVCRFRHALLRDTAYGALPFKLRKELHAQIGERLERTCSDLDREAALLSLHFFLAGRFDKAWLYARVGGKRAREVYANVEASRLLERALEASRKISDVSTTERAQDWEALGDVRLLIGEHQKAEHAYKMARAMVSDDPVETARLIRRQLRVPLRVGRFKSAVRWITRGLKILESIDGDEAARERAELLAWYGGVRQQQGRSKEAVTWLNRAIDEARRAGDERSLAHASYVMDLAASALGPLASFKNSETALAIYRKGGYLEGQANVLNNLGGFAYLRGRWNEAVDYYEQSRLVREKTGDVAKATTGIYNVAEILTDQGRLDEANSRARKAWNVWRASGDLTLAAFAAALLGRIAAYRGDSEEGLRFLRDAKAALEYAGAAPHVVWVEALSAECLTLTRDTETALDLTDAAIDKAGFLTGAADHLPLLHRIRGVSLALLGRAGESITALQTSLELARARSNDYQSALTMRALAALNSVEFSELEEESTALLEGLGVRWNPVDFLFQLGKGPVADFEDRVS